MFFEAPNQGVLPRNSVIFVLSEIEVWIENLSWFNQRLSRCKKISIVIPNYWVGGGTWTSGFGGGGGGYYRTPPYLYCLCVRAKEWSTPSLSYI